MINAVHMLIYSQDAEADRAFLRDVLKYPYVDDGDGWLMFKLPPSEIAVHPAYEDRKTELYFLCDDLEATLVELKNKGVEVLDDPVEHEWGIEAAIRLPGGAEVGIYQPMHKTAYNL